MRSLPNAAFSVVTWLEKRGKFVQPELTRAQKRSLLETFQMIDTDGSGLIERRELLEAFQALGLAVSSLQIDEILGAADSDGSGSVDFMEFLHLMTSVLKTVQDVSRDNKPGGSKGMPLQLLATAYRRRKTLEGVMNNNTFRRRLICQNEGLLAREETVRLTRRRMSIRQRQTDAMGVDLTPEPRFDVSREQDPPRAPSSSSSSTSSKQRQRQQPITGLVLEIDVGLDFSDDSEDFHTPYWKTRRAQVAEEVKRKFSIWNEEVEDLTGMLLPTPRKESSRSRSPPMVKFSDNHASQSNEDITDFKENQWPRSGKDMFWLRDDAGGDQGTVDTSRNSFVGKVIPITRRHGAISGLSLAPEADIHNRASLFNSVASSTPAVEVDTQSIPPPRKAKNFHNTYTSRRAKSVMQPRSCSVVSVVPKPYNRSRSTDPKNAARAGRCTSNPEMIKELCVNKPNAYKSHIRLQAFEAVRNRS